MGGKGQLTRRKAEGLWRKVEESRKVKERRVDAHKTTALYPFDRLSRSARRKENQRRLSSAPTFSPSPVLRREGTQGEKECGTHLSPPLSGVRPCFHQFRLFSFP